MNPKKTIASKGIEEEIKELTEEETYNSGDNLSVEWEDDSHEPLDDDFLLGGCRGRHCYTIIDKL